MQANNNLECVKILAFCIYSFLKLILFFYLDSHREIGNIVLNVLTPSVSMCREKSFQVNYLSIRFKKC